jgi:hypothetical protein
MDQTLLQILIALSIAFVQAEPLGVGATLYPGQSIAYSESLITADPNPDMRIVMTFVGIEDGQCVIQLRSAQQDATFQVAMGKGMDETPVTPALWCGWRAQENAVILNLMSHVKRTLR